MEDSSLYVTSDSESKNSEAISDSNVTSLGDHDSTDNLSSIGLSDNQQINEGEKTVDTTDVQKIPVEGHDINEEKVEDKEEDDGISERELVEQMGLANLDPGSETRKESERKSGAEEENIGEDDNEPPRQEPITAPAADLQPAPTLKGSLKQEDKPGKAKSVTWSPTLEEFAPREDETETSRGRGGRRGAGRNKRKGKKHGGSSSKHGGSSSK